MSDGADTDSAENGGESLDFIREIIAEDLAAGKNDGRLITRFPPEPSGYLHIGHAKAFCLDFGAPLEFADRASAARCHLRMDDTNPAKEDVEYVEAIQEDIRWLGFDWGEHFYFASDYYEKLYGYAVELIEKGLAYVDSQTSEEIRVSRGSLTEPGTDSPHRDRPIEETLDLFRRMRAGEFADGELVLRAKIDMAHANVHMRDPAIYRILHVEHHRTGKEWCIYPLYDFAHPLSDALEGITHSLCSLEFENHRPLYDWFVENCSVPSTPRQIEFARLNLSYTITSKRKLQKVIAGGHVSGWNDPRMPTLSGLRRAGYTPEAIRDFIGRVGMTKFNSLTDVALLEFALREHLNATVPRAMAVLNPLKVVVTNYPEDQVEEMQTLINPANPDEGTRTVPFSRELYIEREDFMEDPPKKFFRLGPDREVRLRAAYWVKCTDIIRDDNGEVVELHVTYDSDTRGGENPPDGRKVKGTLHWVSARHAVDSEVRLYDRLFSVPEPEADGADFIDNLNPDSLTVIENAKLDPALAKVESGYRCQFERTGYFCADSEDHVPGERPVFNRTVALRDSWGKAKG